MALDDGQRGDRMYLVHAPNVMKKTRLKCVIGSSYCIFCATNCQLLFSRVGAFDGAFWPPHWHIGGRASPTLQTCAAGIELALWGSASWVVVCIRNNTWCEQIVCGFDARSERKANGFVRGGVGLRHHRHQIIATISSSQPLA